MNGPKLPGTTFCDHAKVCDLDPMWGVDYFYTLQFVPVLQCWITQSQGFAKHFVLTFLRS